MSGVRGGTGGTARAPAPTIAAASPRWSRWVVGRPVTVPAGWVRAWVVPLAPAPDDPAGTCPVCGFDSLVLFPLYLLTEVGVTPLRRRFGVCGRCADTPGC